MRSNPETLARAKGYIRRPLGYQGENAAWLCGDCGRIAQASWTLIQPHGGCKGGCALALIHDDKQVKK